MKKVGLFLAVIFLLTLQVNAQRESEKDSLRFNYGLMFNVQAEASLKKFDNFNKFENFTDLYAFLSIGNYGFTLTPFYRFSGNYYGTFIEYEFKQCRAYSMLMVRKDELSVSFGLARRVYSFADVFAEANNSCEGMKLIIGATFILSLGK